MKLLILGALLVVVGVVVFAIGFVLYANATGVAPERQTPDDRTGVKRAAARVKWSDVFRRIPSSLTVIAVDDDAKQSERRAAFGSLTVLAGLLTVGAGALALLAGLL
ncbi:hypothetical protein [Mycobacterium bourgelatii]|uniref:Uncharacterized protein n=1 Tax=Mycobacterium bourgelatii TaxID=1273442 RepID=A0A7I9YQB3_MYCBU|nr:hypothetical protein [Mycobacterium bourgelatii]MCV6976067.1 hypothetical protein [Mycobacterium bourgelatii]GFG90797.1 hypothetical protein MBOU_28390 [Mycobacterium bourgelatii]